MKQSISLKAMPIYLSLLCFGIPFLIITIGIYLCVPVLNQFGLPILWGFIIFLAGTLALILTASFVAYRMEGNPLSWTGIKKRFRLKALKKNHWLWVAGLVIVNFGSSILTQPIAKWLVSIPIFKPPDFVPALFTPGGMTEGTIPTELFGVPLLGNWWFVIGFFLYSCFNIFGEEFWWRGYILPRQELAHGKWAWLVHGLLWTFYHGFFIFNLISHLIPCLCISYTAYKLKSTTPGFVFHWIGNSLVLIIILLGVLGVKLP